MALENITHNGGQDSANTKWFRWTAQGRASDIEDAGSVVEDAFIDSSLVSGDVVRLLVNRDKDGNDYPTDNYATVCYPFEQIPVANDGTCAYGLLHSEKECVKTKAGKLGTFDQEFLFEDKTVVLKKVVVIAHKNVANETVININDKDDNRLGQITVANPTAAFLKKELYVNRQVSEKITVAVNAEVANESKTDCTVSLVFETLAEPYLPFPVNGNQKIMVAETSDIGNFNHKFVFGHYVTVRQVIVVPDQQNVLQVALKMTDKGGNDLANFTMVIANASPVGVPIFGLPIKLHTNICHVQVTAPVVSVTKARVIVVYEELTNNTVQIECPGLNGNVIVHYQLSDQIDGTVDKAYYYAQGNGNAGLFRVTLNRTDQAMTGAEVNTTGGIQSPVLQNNDITPAHALNFVTTASGVNNSTVMVGFALHLA